MTEQTELPLALYVWLTPKSIGLLAARFTFEFPNRSGDHVTIKYGPTLADYERFRLLAGKFVTLTATHVVTTDRVQAVKIRGVDTALGTPHVTLSWAAGASPIESNAAVAIEKGAPIQPWLKLQGRYGYYPAAFAAR